MIRIDKLLKVLFFIVYLLTMSKAVFGNEASDLVRSKPKMTNEVILKKLTHPCKGHRHADLNAELLVDVHGQVKDIKLVGCNNGNFRIRTMNTLKALRFIPAISVTGQAIPSLVKLKIDF